MDILTFLALVLVLLCLLDYLWKPKTGNILPYRIPIFGHLWLFWSGETHKDLTYWADKTGYNVFTIQVFHKTVVVLNGYDAIYEGLVTKGKETGGRIRSFRMKLCSDDGKDIFTQDICPNWKRNRKVLHSYLKQYDEGVPRIQEILHHIAMGLVESLKAETASTGGVEPTDEVNIAVVNTVTSLITGKLHTKDDPTFKKWLKVSTVIDRDMLNINNGWELDLFPWLRHFGHPTYLRIKDMIETSHDLFNDIKKTSQNSGKDKGLEMGLGHALLNDPNDLLEDNAIRLLFVSIIAGGIVSMSVLLNSFLQIMACYPDKQEKLYQEIQETLRRKRSHRINLSDREDMPYTQALLLEFQRYATIGALGAPHVALTDLTVQGCPIKQDSIVFQNFWQLHHDPQVWQNPWEFIPERFLNDSEDGIISPDHLYRKNLLAFGAGPRSCPGNKVSMSRFFIFATTLVGKCVIEAEGGVRDKSGIYFCDPRCYETAVALIPQKRKLKLTQRKIPKNSMLHLAEG